MLKVADLEFDTVRRRASRGGRDLGLSPKETILLELLMRNAGQPVTRDMIAEVVAPAVADMDALIDALGALDGVERTTSSVVLSTKIDR